MSEPLTSTPLVEQLRLIVCVHYGDAMKCLNTRRKAADEIARLRGDLNIARLQRDAKLCSQCPRTPELERLRALLKQCEEELSWCESHWGADYSELLSKIRGTNETRHHPGCLVIITGGLDGPCDCGGR